MGILKPVPGCLHRRAFASNLLSSQAWGSRNGMLPQKKANFFHIWDSHGKGYIRHRRPGPHPWLRLALPSSGVDSASIQHRFPDLTLFRCQIDPWEGEDEVDSRVGSGGPVPNRPLFHMGAPFGWKPFAHWTGSVFSTPDMCMTWGLLVSSSLVRVSSTIWWVCGGLWHYT